MAAIFKAILSLICLGILFSERKRRCSSCQEALNTILSFSFYVRKRTRRLKIKGKIFKFQNTSYKYGQKIFSIHEQKMQLYTWITIRHNSRSYNTPSQCRTLFEAVKNSRQSFGSLQFSCSKLRKGILKEKSRDLKVAFVINKI